MICTGFPGKAQACWAGVSACCQLQNSQKKSRGCGHRNHFKSNSSCSASGVSRTLQVASDRKPNQTGLTEKLKDKYWLPHLKAQSRGLQVGPSPSDPTMLLSMWSPSSGRCSPRKRVVSISRLVSSALCNSSGKKCPFTRVPAEMLALSAAASD